MSVVSMKSLLESGVHFGHQTRRWDPRMSKFIFAERNGIHIIDLQKTIVEIKKAYDAVRKTVVEGKSVLFVGTKKQARSAIQKEAEKCNQFYVNHRWLGGMLTNFSTIKKSIIRLKKIEKMEIDGTFDSLVKKEKLKLLKEKKKLEENLGGIKEMNTLPGMIFIIDSKKETIAVTEAKKLNIPTVAVVDTNCNPNEIDFPIPGNDDAIRAIELFCSIVSNACIEANNEIGAIIIDTGEESSNSDKTDSKAAVNTDRKQEETPEPKPIDNKEKNNSKEDSNKGGKKDMSVSMTDVKKLRDLTKAGMMDCKNALVESSGNFDEALKILKEKGLADAKKRSDKETKEGGVYIKEDGNKIGAALIGCETDFVSKNEFFLEAKDKILDKIIATGKENVEAYEDEIQFAMSKNKENMELKTVKYLDLKDNQCASTYIHGNNKIGVVAVFECSDTSVKDKEGFKDLANNICLHITANNPYYLSKEFVPDSEIEEQKSIIMKQMEGTNKPANVIENIINGKISKHLSEVCLVNQKYVKDDKLTVEKYLETASKELGSDIKIVNFVRLMVGN